MMPATTTDALRRLQEWYFSQCDGDWEHSYGITIETLDNPGWSLTVELTDTVLQDEPFAEVKQQCDSPDEWWQCSVHDRKFAGAGGPLSLVTLIETFLLWAGES